MNKKLKYVIYIQIIVVAFLAGIFTGMTMKKSKSDTDGGDKDSKKENISQAQNPSDDKRIVRCKAERTKGHIACRLPGIAGVQLAGGI